MTLTKHELNQGSKTLAIWTVAIGCLIAICVFLFPEMKGEMEGVSKLFASMGFFTQAFGMDRLNFGAFNGFYALECGNVLGLGGAFFAALIAITALAKEETDRTSEFLLTHPVSRTQIITEKLIAIMLQIIVMNLVVFGCTAISAVLIGETASWREIVLLHLAYFLLQIELAGICFGISAFLRRGGLGIGLGIAAMMYFFNLIANISKSTDFLKYITPFGYTEGADIITKGHLNAPMVLLGMFYMVVGISLAYLKYNRKDIC